MLNWIKQFNIFCFLDNHGYTQPSGSHECLVAAGARKTLWKQTGQPVLSLVDDFLTGDWVFGHLGYGLAAETEGIQMQHPDQIGFSPLLLFVPEIVIQLQPDHCIIETIDVSPELVWEHISASSAGKEKIPEQKIDIRQRFSKTEYLETVQRLQQHILRGDCYEINFCQEFYAEHTVVDPLYLYRSLSRESPNPFAVFYRAGDQYLACASPERYLRKLGAKIFCQPIKGTSRRNLEQPLLDREQADYLKHSEKEKAENVMVVDIVRNDLSRICKKGTVQVEELFGIYSFPQVHQMISTVSGELRPEISFADIIKASFPMASMTGAPKKRVMELIEQYEKTARGLFSGAVGYISPSGDFDFNVVIRSLFYQERKQYLSFQAGSGITFYSEAEKEWEECLLKAAAIKKVLAPGQH